MNKELSAAREILLNLKTVKNSMTFQKLWDSVCNKLKLSESTSNDNASDFYIALLEDTTFIKVNNEWSLKEFFAYDDVKKINSPVYPTEEFEINEDEYGEYLSNYEIKQLKGKKENITSGLALGDIDDGTGSDIGGLLKTSELDAGDEDAISEGEEYDE